ncbi:MAG: maleylpyruvate isomerase family mycothiol-dependent enzyme [Thermomicrobiales bacterium]
MRGQEPVTEVVAALEGALDVFGNIVRALAPEQLSLSTINDGWNVRDVINHVLDNEHWSMATIEGRVWEFSLAPEFIGDDDPTTVVERTGAALLDMARSHAISEQAEYALTMTVIELTGHGWDIAETSGQPTDLAPDIASWCLAVAKQTLDEPGARGEFFKPAVPISDMASAADRFAAYLGKPVAASR